MTMSTSTREVRTMHNHGNHMKLMLGAVAGIFVLAAFGVRVVSYAPLLILLLCPLMMMFMMRGMDHGGNSGDSDREDRSTAHRH